MTTPTLEGGTPGSLLDDHIEPFLKHFAACAAMAVCVAFSAAMANARAVFSVSVFIACA